MKSHQIELLDYLRHYRHDWMNHLQIMKAYLSMDKTIDAQRYMDQIILSAQNEAKLCQLVHPELAFYLLTYNWHKQCVIKVEVEVSHDQDMLHSMSIADKYPYLYDWVKEITGIIERRVDPNEENQLFYIFMVEDHSLQLRIEFEGVWNGVSGQAALHELEEKIRADRGNLAILDCSDTDMIIELCP